MIKIVFYLIVMRTFINSIPDSICESAKMDGANDFVIFVRLVNSPVHGGPGHDRPVHRAGLLERLVTRCL